MSENRRPKYHVAILLAPSPLGWFGAHKYYVGKKKSAVMYALLVITFISPLLAVLDGFILMYKGREDFLEKYGTEEDMTEYYLKEVLDRNPQAISPQFKIRLAEADSVSDVLDVADGVEDVDDEDSEQIDALIEELQEMKDSDQSDEDDTEGQDDESVKVEKPDYDDYYGDW